MKMEQPTGGIKSVVFASLPVTLAGFEALPQAALQSPYDTAALFVVALNAWQHNRDECVGMINLLKGPEPLNRNDINFLAERMADKATYLANSYFKGATPKNNYAPAEPFTVVIGDNPHSFAVQNVAKLFVNCGGADSPRPISMRLAKDGKWYLWEYSSILVGIRPPESTNPWA